MSRRPPPRSGWTHDRPGSGWTPDGWTHDIPERSKFSRKLLPREQLSREQFLEELLEKFFKGSSEGSSQGSEFFRQQGMEVFLEKFFKGASEGPSQGSEFSWLSVSGLLWLLFGIFGIFGIFGQIFFAGVLGGYPLLVFLFGSMIWELVILIVAIVKVSRLRARAVRVTGVAVRQWSETSTHRYNREHDRERPDDWTTITTTSYLTKVGFVVGADRYVVTISGAYAVGSGVPISYDPDDPGVAYSELNISEVVRHLIIPIVIGLVIFIVIMSVIFALIIFSGT